MAMASSKTGWREVAEFGCGSPAIVLSNPFSKGFLMPMAFSMCGFLLVT